MRRPDRPTALITINDLLGMAAIRAAVDLDLSVPGDVSVAGFDDIPFISFTVPRLTTVSGYPEKERTRRCSPAAQSSGRPRSPARGGHERMAASYPRVDRAGTYAPPVIAFGRHFCRPTLMTPDSDGT
ncbi:MAG: substrate-binding domain-containing protein [Chloroflexi bacterium]|nr:substrate-binding domain-containing protein [Chloroflexota bacterium]